LHTSASLLIQENADPTARQDLEEFLERLAPEGQSWHRHTLEGPDDTTSHLKSALTNSSLNIPISNCALGLGTWQGIYLWEHRRSAHLRRLTLTVLS
jgi:secondary thiamine-phosphate synthase enzyme